jgi:Ca-activated chloride channel homolog
VKKLNVTNPYLLTYIGGALTSATAALQSEGRSAQFTQKVIIMMSDGNQTYGTITPQQGANAAAAANIIVYTIGFGTDADPVTLKAIAATTGGTYYAAPTGTDLTNAFKTIAQSFHSVLTQ